MPKVVINDHQGLVQSTGAGVTVNSSMAYGSISVSAAHQEVT